MKPIVWSLIAASLTLASMFPAAAADRELSVVNINYEGNNVWVPNTIVVKKGDTVRLKLFNRVPTAPNVHGFAIPEFGVKVDVNRGQTESVEFVADKAGLFRIECHLHPAHFPGTLVVLE